jgi:hypothetical protein
MTIEVFKTNVQEACHAKLLADEIHNALIPCRVNFDLQDCDRILRIETLLTNFDGQMVIEILHNYGFHAEVLSNDVPHLIVNLETNK